MRSARFVALMSVAAASGAYLFFGREMRQRSAALEAASQCIGTSAGPIEYAREGTGPAVLFAHGAGGGFDQGLLMARDMFGVGYDTIAPSRFGYLGTPLPPDASPAAQADAHAALLDALAVDKAIVVGVSAGAPGVIEMALRHPDRISAMILAVPMAYAPGVTVGVDHSARSRAVLGLISGGADFAYWLAIGLARSSVVRFLGVPPAVEAAASGEERARITAIMRGILPLSRRTAGLKNDGEVAIGPRPLETITAPTLVISAADDLYRTLPAARFAAGHIVGAELKVFETGGHLLVSRGAEVRRTITAFLGRLMTA